MRKILPLFLLALALVSTLPAAADPGFELTPFVGYRFAGEFNVDDPFFDLFADPEIDESESLGVILSFPIHDNFYVELLYSTQDSDLLVSSGIFAPEEVITDVTLDYAMVGITWQWSPGQVRPFLGVSAGAAQFDPGGGFGSETSLALDVHGGVKLMFTNHLGVRLEARAYYVDFGEIDLDDCCDDTGSFYQVEAGGGLILKF